MTPDRAEDGVFLSCEAVACALRHLLSAGSVVLRLTGKAFLAPELFEVGGCEGAPELV